MFLKIIYNVLIIQFWIFMGISLFRASSELFPSCMVLVSNVLKIWMDLDDVLNG